MDGTKNSSGALIGGGLAVALLAILMCWLFLRADSAAEANSAFLLDEEPQEAVDVLAFRKDAKDAQEVVVVGRIGGRVNPWIEGTAAFPIVDRSLKPCNEIEGDTCATPWDYCCEAELPQATALVMFVDEAGKPVKTDPRELLNVKELQTVVVQGKAKRDEADNVTILATKIFVQPDTKAKE